MSQVSDEPIILSSETQVGRQGVKMQMVSAYVPPLDGTPDEVKGFDIHIAKGVLDILARKYFGYPWRVTAETRQGIIAFQIPELMGPTLHYIIRLAEFKDLDADLIIRCGGELLERMGLPRSQIDMAAYATARENLQKFDFADVKR
jgi:hypothetical protein